MILWMSLAMGSPADWQAVRQAGFVRTGPRVKGSLAVGDFAIEVHNEPFLRAPNGESSGALPKLGDLDLDAARDQFNKVLTQESTLYNLTIHSLDKPPLEWNEKGYAIRMQSLLKRGLKADTVASLRVHAAWCTPAHTQICVRNPDTLLGEAPLAVVGYAIAKRTQNGHGRWKGRPTLITSSYHYVSFGDDVWGAEGIPGDGSTPQEQLEDAVGKAASLWLRAAVGKRAVRKAKSPI